MNIQNAFPSKWLKSGDVEEGDLILTIRNVVIEDIGSGDQQEQKPVIYFEETEKGMVLNKTNADTISKLHTPETDNWLGKKISIFATEVDFAGKQTLALRVRMRAPKAVTTTATTPSVTKQATIKCNLADLKAVGAGFAESQPHYANEEGGLDMFHFLKAAAASGFHSITDENMLEVFDAVGKRHAE